MTNKLPTMLGAGVETTVEAVSHFPQVSFAQASHFLTVHKLKLTTQQFNLVRRGPTSCQLVAVSPVRPSQKPRQAGSLSDIF